MYKCLHHCSSIMKILCDKQMHCLILVERDRKKVERGGKHTENLRCNTQLVGGESVGNEVYLNARFYG